MVDAVNDRRRFSELLPLYVNDTLSAEDHAWMSAYMDANPETKNELRFVQVLRETTRSTASKIPEHQRVERLLSEWQKDRPSTSMLQNALHWLQHIVRVPAPAIAVVTVLVIGQTAIIGSLLTNGSDEPMFRGERPGCVTTPSIRVVFNPDAKHVEILLLLRKIEATIQRGPSETGELWLTTPKGRSLEEAQAMLRSSALVDEAILTNESRLHAGCAE
jgi:hypothetical protein